MMPKFLYKTFLCEEEDLHNELNQAGAEGWRLHTCEPVIEWGESCSKKLKIFVVMDQAYMDDPEENEEEELPVFEGIAMKG